jgi:hypothetical protein
MFKKIFLSIFLALCSFRLLSGNIELITSNSDATTISKNEVRQLFLLKKKRLTNGALITLIQMNKDNSLHKKFLRDILKISSEDYNRIINNSNNSGNGSYVITVTSQSEMVRKVMSIQNSIGYIDNDYLLFNSLDNNIIVYKIIE